MSRTEFDTQELLARARSMFEFLRDVQRLRVSTPRDLAQYRRDGFAFDVDELRRPADSTELDMPALDEDWDLQSPLLIVPRVPEVPPPSPPKGVAVFLHGPITNPTRTPTINQSLLDAEAEGVTSASLETHLAGASVEQMVIAAEHYLNEWGDWAAVEQENHAVRTLYSQIYKADESAATDSQSWEFLLGLGRARLPATHDRDAVDRPLLTVPVRATSRSSDGALEVRIPSAAQFTIETDMFAPGDLTSSAPRQVLADGVCTAEANELTKDEIQDSVRDFVNTGLLAARMVTDEDLLGEGGAAVALRPLLIFRKRSMLASVSALDNVARYLGNATELPDGLGPVVDPTIASEVPRVDEHHPEGAVVTRGGEQFTPLPVNTRQWDVIRRADSRPLTLVQGPPGTGKTHTTAALISHLLAQGKRILVTAHNPAALGEVRSKLPEEIRSLAVSVIGTGEQEMTDLRAAIDSLSRRASDFDRDANEDDVAIALEAIGTLLDRREDLIEQLVTARREESETQSTPFGNLTLSALADQWRTHLGQYEWAREILPDPAGSSTALNLADIPALQRDLRELADDARVALTLELAGGAAVAPLPDAIQQLVEDHRRLAAETEDLTSRADRRVAEQARAADQALISAAETHVQLLLDELRELRSRPEAWITDALADITAGRTRSWDNRLADVSRRLDAARKALAALEPHLPLTITGGPEIARQRLSVLLDWLDSGGQIKLDGTGRPKAKMLTPKPVKEAWPLWTDVTVHGRSITDRDGLLVLQTQFALDDDLAGLDAAWPAGTPVSQEDSAAERLAWHEDELGVLKMVLELPSKVDAAKASVGALPGAYPLSWMDDSAVSNFLEGLTLITFQRQLGHVTKELEQAVSQLGTLGAGSVIDDLRDAVRDLDHDAYRTAYGRWVELQGLRDRNAEADRRLSDLRDRLPELASLLPAPSEGEWPRRFAQLDEAWLWIRLDNWLANQEAMDPNHIQNEISRIEDAIRQETGKLSALRAWGKAVSRLTPDRRADLQAYVTLVKKLGKGTGKYAARQRKDIQVTLNRCRSSVPVWVMPLYRVFESVEMVPDSFDVIIIDEASQASMDALVLQFLAPKVVVVGDDKQVSPSTVGMDLEPVQRLVDTYLSWSPQKAVYKDPARSLFDEARMRFPDLITLTEHRRCVPEIIGFSDEIAYRPEGVPLVPVRETGASALPPLLMTTVEGEVEGVKKVNRAEQEAIVSEILRCLDDPAYDGKTFGVISLLGDKQSKEIEARLIGLLPPEVLKDRDIRCGEAPAFQGGERDVIFLSMVAAWNAGFTALTATPYVQRFNVAVSRAKDQVHLFHSLDLNHPQAKGLKPEDLRARLINYIKERGSALEDSVEPSTPVAVDSFDSTMPTRVIRQVHNILAERGFVVKPQYRALGSPIDLVVVGSSGKAAVQCVDSKWVEEHAYRKTLKHETELQRVGWKIHRVRESSLSIRPERVESELLAFLADAGVEPVVPSSDSGPVDLPEELVEWASGVEAEVVGTSASNRDTRE